MKIYILTIDPNDYDEFPYIHSVHSTEQKAIDAIMAAAIERNEPALLLEHEYDTFERAECYHYPEYNYTRYYIHVYEVD